MQTIQHASNPFAMMLNPKAVLKAMDRSDHLSKLRSEVFRPLDKPLIPKLVNGIDFDEPFDIDSDSVG